MPNLNIENKIRKKYFLNKYFPFLNMKRAKALKKATINMKRARSPLNKEEAKK